MKPEKCRLGIVLLTWGWLAVFTLAHAAESYPARPITLVVPFGVNSDTDHFGRNLATHVAKHLDGAGFTVENRPGASGAMAAQGVRLAPGDGYTLLVARTGNLTIVPALDPATPYRWSDFTLLGVMEIDPLICAVRTDAPYKTVRDLLQAIRQQPGVLKYGSSGAGTMLNLSAQYLLKLSGIKSSAAQNVEFKDGKGAATALINGQVDFLCNVAASMIEPVKSGALRALFTTAPGRLAELPELQNAAEAGVRDMGKFVAWSALVGPPGLPPAVIARWKTALKLLARDADWIAGNARAGGIPALGTVRDSEKFIEEQFELFKQLAPQLDGAR